MMFWYGNGGSWWDITLMWFGMIALWAVILWAVYAFSIGASRRSSGESPDQARRILDERLARGEIDTDEYRSRLDVLTPNNHAPTSVGAPR